MNSQPKSKPWDISPRNVQINSKIHMEMQKAQNSQGILEEEQM